MKNFFVSYNGRDKAWAEWIAYQLEEAGYSTVIQAWDFQAGGNFVLEMQKATAEAERTIAVLSQNYLDAEYTQPEWAAAFAKDPQGAKRILVPVRIAECKLDGLLSQIVYIDLVGTNEQTAKEALLNRIKNERAKPTKSPIFPGQPSTTSKPKPDFPGTAPSERPWNVPHQRNRFFTGREDVLARLHVQLTVSSAAVPTQTHVISGLGGIGKTQTAIEYAYRYRDEYQAVLWATADSREAVVAAFVTIATLLDLPQKVVQDQSLVIAAVKRWLETHSNWLFIFDNADEPQIIDEFLPLQHHGKVLLTSRAQVFDSLTVSSPTELEELPPQEAHEFLLKRTRRENLSQAERDAVAQLAQELDYLPLALEQAAAYLVAKKSRFQDYLVSYREHGVKLLERARPVVGKYPKSVATTWLLNVEQVEKENTAAAEALRVSAFLHPDNIPLEAFVDGAAELGSTLSTTLANAKQDPLGLDEVLEPLTRYSLIRRKLETQTYNIHRLVQEVIKGGMDEATQHVWAERVVCAVSAAFPEINVSTWPECDRFLPHAQVCAALIDTWTIELDAAARLLNWTGYYLHERIQYAQAAPLYQRALAIREKVLGPEHPDVAQSLNNLAGLYDSQGQYAQAAPLYQRALAIREKVLGPEHPDVAQSLNNLAELYRSQGQYTQAAPLLQRALAIYEKVLGPEHPDVATSLNNLAGLYDSQGQYTQAAPLYQRALAIMEEILPDHPNTATLLDNYADLLRKTNREVEAEKLETRAQAIREKQRRET